MSEQRLAVTEEKKAWRLAMDRIPAPLWRMGSMIRRSALSMRAAEQVSAGGARGSDPTFSVQSIICRSNASKASCASRGGVTCAR